jgi:MoxR-like ATPase
MTPDAFRERFNRLANEMSNAVVGYRGVVADLLTGVFAGGNILLEAAPGLGKTVIGKALAAALSMKQTRIQFTPDLMPADIVGTNIIVEDEHGQKEMVFQPGPVFTHVLLADEINRATPKTQSALLEAMQEHHVTVAGKTHALEEPFLVVATQNPEETEGTYRLPEAQIDRFGFRLHLEALEDEDWIEMARRRTGATGAAVGAVLSRGDVIEMQAAVREVAVPREVCAAAARLVTATHPENGAVEAVRRFVSLGSSPRGIQALILGAKVRALCDGKDAIREEDVRSVAVMALSHRLLFNFEGQAERVQAETVIQEILAAAGNGTASRSAARSALQGSTSG